VLRVLLDVVQHVPQMVSAHGLLGLRVHADVGVQLEDARHVVEEHLELRTLVWVHAVDEGLALGLQGCEHCEVAFVKLAEGAERGVLEHHEISRVSARMQVLAEHPMSIVDVHHLRRRNDLVVDELVYPLLVSVETALTHVQLHMVTCVMLGRADK
jgi:uncharacterized protein YwlG (UPF0340 family)